MRRRLLGLMALCALCAVSRSAPCRCVDPVSCPEAVVSPSARSCTLSGGRPGVCCTHQTALPVSRAAVLPAFFVSSSGRTPRRARSNTGLAALPASARKFLQQFPLNTADQGPIRRTARRPRPRPGFTVTAAAAATGTDAQFTARGRGRPAAPSGTTRLNSLNARTSSAAQRSAESTLRALRQARRGAASAAGPRVSTPRVASVASTPAVTFPASFNFGDALAAFSPARRVPSVFAAAPLCRPERSLRCPAAARYRAIDGRCNNLLRPRWGSRLRGLRRIFDNTFEDGVFAPRSRSVSGALLPSARYVSALALSSDSRPQPLFTMAVTTFGQFMDHDLSISPIFQLEQPGGKFGPIECCDQNGRRLPAQLKHPQCLPISVAANDPFYRRFGIRCMNFVRSIPAPEPQCRPRPATQLNDLTSWMDLSQVYASSDAHSRQLRTFWGGRLRTSAGNLLPREVPQPTTNCTSRICFIAGDERVNENTLLTLFHTVFMREHNRVAAALAARHRSWSDEKLFQEARRVAIAEWQHIAYQEWLPTIVGYRFARQMGLSGYGRYSYVPVLNPTVSTEFSTAGFRLHSLVQGVIELVSRIGTIRRQLQLTDNFFRPDSLVVSTLFTEMARGLTQQQPQSYDKRFASAIRGNLFKVGPFGLDLVALNIQRGRDHGIPTYATVAARCNGISISGWASFRQLIPFWDVSRLQQVYSGHWQDVDLFVGINMERKAPGALVGPTARCLIADQFLRARYGDRFFYDQAGHSGSFSTTQLYEIRKASWARLLCDNVGRGFDAVQPLAFIKPINVLRLNPVVSCNSYRIKRVNLNRF